MTRLARRALLVGALVALSPAAPAQGRHVFVIDTPTSAFTFSGSVTLPGFPSIGIQGNPSNFNLGGRVDVDLTVVASTLTAGQMVQGGSVVTVPTLSAVIPNPIPFLPPLATINVTGVQVVFTSPSFPIAANGAFSTTVTANLLAGTAVISGVINQTIPLAGTQSNPQAVNGTVTSTATGFRLHVPLQTTFSFTDPGTGASGTLTLNGNARADDLELATDVATISLATGGTQTYTLSAGTAVAGDAYLLLGTLSGTSPGLTWNGVNLPLNADDWLLLSLFNANMGPFGNTASTLDGLGVATATFSLPPLPIPVLVGLRFDWAYLVVQGTTWVLASNPVPLTLVQ